MLNLNKSHQKSNTAALIGLSLVKGLGAQRIRLLLQQVGKPEAVFHESIEKLQAINGIGEKTAATIRNFDDWERVDNVIRQTRRADARILSYYDDDYPERLRQIYDPSMLLWVKGEVKALSTPSIAVVGTRRATTYGLDQAQKISEKLTQRGLTVISGLAYGVDSAAHSATVQAGGCTVAVLGSGIDVMYPKKNAGLAADIIDKGGAIITECLPGAAPDAKNFPERNRIVSGLSLGTVVIESGLKGGSMITAQQALTQNREVFVVPHALTNVNGQGCNHLIKRGAGKLVQGIDDITDELPLYTSAQSKNKAPIAAAKPNWKSANLDETAIAICSCLEDGQKHIDDLSEELQRPSHALLGDLLQLEMKNCVRQSAGKNFALV